MPQRIVVSEYGATRVLRYGSLNAAAHLREGSLVANLPTYLPYFANITLPCNQFLLTRSDDP